MPWCPKCKNEYKAGISVCADCGCELLDKLGQEIVIYFGPEDEADVIIDYLSERGFDFAYKKYNSKDAHYEVLIQESKKEAIRATMKEYFTTAHADEIAASAANEMATPVIEAEEIVKTHYKKPSERSAEYKAGAQSLVLVGIVGVIFLLLVDFEKIPIVFNGDQKILINVVMGAMFAGFILVGLNSYKTYKKLLAQSSDDEKLENDIMEWFKDNVTVSDLTVGENPKDAEELLFFNRFKMIKAKINNQFKDVDPAFVEYLADKLYNEMFK